MKKILLGISLLLFMASIGYCQESKQPLQLTIKSDKQVYEMGEPIYIDYEIKNMGEDDMNIFVPSSESKIIDRPVHFFIKENKWGGRKNIFAGIDNNPDKWKRYILTLKGGDTYTKKLNIVKFHYCPEREEFYFPMDKLLSGEYTITAEYDWPEVAANANCLESHCWAGTLVSNDIVVKVAEKRPSASSSGQKGH